MAYDSELYGDEPSTQDRVAPTEPKPEGDESKGEGKTALINSDICPGMKEGDEMVVHIDKVMEGQYMVSYAPEPEHKDEGDKGEAQMPQGGRDTEMASMME